jgi:hypothetical protein
MHRFLLPWGAFFGLAAAPFALADTAPAYSNSLDTVAALDDFSSIVGSVSIDTSRAYAGAGSLRIAPEAELHLVLGDTNQAARVEMWMYDDMTVPANPDERRSGPRWGLEQVDRRFCGPALIYAPFVTTESNYVAPDRGPGGTWYNMQFLSQGVRSEGWHKWTFEMDPVTGLKIYFDDTAISSFSWSKTDFRGVAGLAFYGDSSGDNPHTIWIDEISVEFLGPMEYLPDGTLVEDEVVEKIVPDEDPVYEGPDLGIIEEVASVRPRVLFGPEDLDRMRAFYNAETGYGAEFGAEIESYALTSQAAPITDDFLTNATEAQRYGFWQLPTLAMHYLMTGDQVSFEKAVDMMEYIVDMETWDTSSESDSGMSAANILLGAGLALDWLYNDLDETFRAKFQAKVWEQTRKMYYMGYLERLDINHYWQQDPQPNQRHHRAGGFILAGLASYPEDGSGDFLVAEMKKEMSFIMEWMPEDGSNHESGHYAIFGLPYLDMPAHAVDRFFGSNLSAHPYFKNLPFFRAHHVAPGFRAVIPYGDDWGRGLGYYNIPLYSAVWETGNVHVQKLFDEVRRRDKSVFLYPWMLLATLPEIEIPAAGEVSAVPTSMHFPDLDMVFFREGWDGRDAAAHFKCGIPGGLRLNEYRDEFETYINIAHDDPDANSFVIWKDRDLVAVGDAYSWAKRTSNHNSLLVNGKGQTFTGQAEGPQFLQPPSSPTESMIGRAYITAYRDAGDIVVAEGEAAGSYPHSSMTRFRRTFIWNEGKYVLLFDDLRATQSEEYSWLVQSAAVDDSLSAEGRFTLTSDATRTLNFQLVSSASYTSEVVDSTADNEGASLELRQLQATASGTVVHFVAAFDVWDLGVEVTLVMDGDDAATITVTDGTFTDTWEWEAAPDSQTEGSFILTSSDGQSLSSIGDPASEFFGRLNFRSGDWLYSDWAGWVYPQYFPWFYTLNQGWLYAMDGDADQALLWSLDHGWILTTAQVYPWIYVYSTRDWVLAG